MYISVAHVISEGAVKPLDSDVTTRNGSEQDVAVLPSTKIQTEGKVSIN